MTVMFRAEFHCKEIFTLRCSTCGQFAITRGLPCHEKGNLVERMTRSRWMSILARADGGRLQEAWKNLSPAPVYSFLRRPETGLVMLRARAGGTGNQFNLGEASVTRCAVRCADKVGFAYVLGRDHQQAELAAAFDALLQDQERHAGLTRDLLHPLAAEQQAARENMSRKVASTKVDFYTMVRGDSA